jgi:hypothetical protein
METRDSKASSPARRVVRFSLAWGFIPAQDLQMAHPNKPQLAFAWIGTPQVLTPLWYAMIQTPFAGQAPRELMPRPQIMAAETETWSYRFSRCEKLSELLYMRCNARRQAAILWCKEGKKQASQEEYKMLCYAGGCRLPIVVFVQNIEEATEEADQEERETRAFLDELGFLADEALFIYRATPTKLPAALLHLYQRLDQSSLVTAEQSLPPMLLRCEEAKILTFLPLYLDCATLLPEVEVIHENLRILPGNIQETARHDKTSELQTLVLHLKFYGMASLMPEQVFSMKLGFKVTRSFMTRECVVFV